MSDSRPMEERFDRPRPAVARFRMAALLVPLSLAGCGEPSEAPVEPQTITPTPAEEALGAPSVSEEDQGGPGAQRADPDDPWQRPNTPGADLAERIFGEQHFRLSREHSMPRRRRLYIYVPEGDEEWCLVVLVGRVGDRLSTQRLPCSGSQRRPEVRLLSPDYGPGLIRVQMRSEHEAPTDSGRRRRPRGRAQERTFGETREILFTLDRAGGLQQVHETVTSSNSIASARTTWGARAQTLTLSIQRRNPPGRERCRRRRPETVVHTWRGGHFEQTQADPGRAPCGE